MALESFIWCWIHLHPYYVLQRLARLLLLAAMVLIPLLYINVDMVRKGFQLTPPKTEIQVARPMPGDVGTLEAER